MHRWYLGNGRGLLLAALLLISSAAAVAAPGGLNTIPTADIYDPGTASLELQMDGETRLFDRDCSQYLLTQFGVLPDVEVGADVCLSGDGEPVLLNAKVRLLDGQGPRPSLALGIQNLASGTSLQPYVVAGLGSGRPLRFHAGAISLEGRLRSMLGVDVTWRSLTFQADWTSGRGNMATLGVSWAPRGNITVTYAAGLPRFPNGRLPHSLNVQYLMRLR